MSALHCAAMMKLYSYARSGHAQKVRALLSILGVDHTIEEVDLMSRGSRTEAFLAINPFGHVPVLDDDGFVVRDSNAILVYLAQAYDPSGRWLPSEPKASARVHEWLATSTLDLVIGPAYARAAKVFGRNLDGDLARERAARLLPIVDQHLDGRRWLATDHATIADLAMYPYLAHAPEGGISLAPHARLRDWIARVEGIEGFVGMPRSEIT